MASPLVIVPALSAVAIKFRQKNLIADLVMPRSPVEKQEFIDLSDRMGEWLTPPETGVGRTDAPGKLSTSVQDPTYLATLNNGLDEPVPNQDEKNGPSESALARATQRVMGFVELRRELRVANIVGTTGNFGYSKNYTVAAEKWNDPDSDPLSDLLAHLDMPFMRPNKLVMGRVVWTALSKHPKLVHIAFGPAITNGRITKQQLADLLEIEDIIVGDGWINTAKKGQAVTKTRIWGKVCAGIYQGDINLESNGTWGYTAQFGSRVAGTLIDGDIGLYGGVKVRAGESVREVVTAPEFGFVFTNVVA